jgi:hypothetical protein
MAKALELIICNRFSGLMVVFRCFLFFFVECVSNRDWVSKNNESLMGMLFVPLRSRTEYCTD